MDQVKSLKSIVASHFENEIKSYLDEEQVRTRNNQVSFIFFQCNKIILFYLIDEQLYSKRFFSHKTNLKFPYKSEEYESKGSISSRI